MKRYANFLAFRANVGLVFQGFKLIIQGLKHLVVRLGQFLTMARKIKNSIQLYFETQL